MKKCTYAAGLAVLGMALAGCSGNLSNASGTGNVTAVSFDSYYESGSFGSAVADRCANVETSLNSSVNTVLSTPSSILEKNESDIKKLSRFVADGNNLVVIGPTVSQMKQICERLAVYENDVVSVNGFLTAEDNGITYKAIALRGNDVAYMYDQTDGTDEDAVSEAVSESSEQCTEDAGTSLEETVTVNADDSMADSLNEWLSKVDDSKKERAAKRALGTNAKDIMEAQEFTHLFTAESRLGTSMTVTVVDDVWPMCSIDNKKDYYVVHQTVTCPNNQLGYSNTWGNNKKIGPYFRSACVTGGQIGGEARILREVSPQTSQGSTSYSSGTSISLGGNVGLTPSGPTCGLNTGISFSESSSRSIPDISVVYNQGDTNCTNWTFTAPEPATGWSGLYTYGKDAPAIARNTAIFDTYCIYEMDSSTAGNNPVFSSCVKVQVENLYGTLSGFLNSNLTTHYEWRTCSTYISDHVSAPARYMKDYIMGFEAPEDLSIQERATLSAYLDNVFGSNWQNAKTYYTVNENDSAKTVSDFDAAMVKFNNNKTELKNKGFKGTWKFYVKAASAGDQNYIKCETIIF